MATNLELVKAIEEGMEIRITMGPDTYGEVVEYAPRRKGDRQPWVLRSGATTFHFAADEVAAVAPAATDEVPFLQEETPAAPVTPEMIRALQTLRDVARRDMAEIKVVAAFNVLDDAGVFAAIDRAAQACTCPADERAKSGTDNHYIECPQAPRCECPARWVGIKRPVHSATCPARAQ